MTAITIDHVPTSWTPEDFGDRAGPHRRELLVHCYRMLGTVDDAEDAVQDALARAWSGRETYRRGVSFRAWLYRIATNVCLDELRRRARGPRRVDHAEHAVSPAPDAWLGLETSDHGLVEPGAVEPGPEPRYVARESVSLAFIVLLQRLPARQRAVLLLRDVLDLRAAEVADLLDLSLPAVNSLLQRARATMRASAGPARATTGDQRRILERYVRAWEAADVAGLVGLLRDDAVLVMPPMPSVMGATAVGRFLELEILAELGDIRLVAVRANGGAAWVAYGRPHETTAEAPRRPFALMLAELDGTRIARINAWADSAVIERFGVPATLPG